MLLVFHPPYGWELNRGRGNRGNTVFFFLGKKLPSKYSLDDILSLKITLYRTDLRGHSRK